MSEVRILQGDCRDVLKTLPDESVHCCVTSPPYFGLRDYGTATWEGGDDGCDHIRIASIASSTIQGGKGAVGHQQEGWKNGVCGHCGARRTDSQIGLEQTPDAYVAELVVVFREVRRVLRGDGTLWLNLGDSYNAYNGGAGPSSALSRGAATTQRPQLESGYGLKFKGLKPKDMLEIPSAVASALRADGWWLRSRIPWVKRNSMPESTSDRPTSSVEYVFLLSKSERYYYDHEAVKVRSKPSTVERGNYGWNGITGDKKGALTVGARNGSSFHDCAREGKTMAEANLCAETRSRRNSDWFFESWCGLWEENGDPLAFVVNPAPYKGAHFAIFPAGLVQPCILAGCPVGGTVLDCFGGSGTTGMVAREIGRNAILIELNPAYIPLIEARINVTPGLPL